MSFHGVEKLLTARGMVVTYETVRRWCLKFGESFANAIRCPQGRRSDAWDLDEVFVTINGQRHYFWRAVDQDGDTLDILVQRHREGALPSALREL